MSEQLIEKLEYHYCRLCEASSTFTYRFKRDLKKAKDAKYNYGKDLEDDVKYDRDYYKNQKYGNIKKEVLKTALLGATIGGGSAALLKALAWKKYAPVSGLSPQELKKLGIASTAIAATLGAINGASVGAKQGAEDTAIGNLAIAKYKDLKRGIHSKTPPDHVKKDVELAKIFDRAEKKGHIIGGVGGGLAGAVGGAYLGKILGTVYGLKNIPKIALATAAAGAISGATTGTGAGGTIGRLAGAYKLSKAKSSRS